MLGSCAALEGSLTRVVVHLKGHWIKKSIVQLMMVEVIAESLGPREVTRIQLLIQLVQQNHPKT